MFDIVVQNGGISGDARPHRGGLRDAPGGSHAGAAEIARMRIIANRRADSANPQFASDVRTRKLTIADGIGIVHGIGFDLERQYGLGLAPAEGL